MRISIAPVWLDTTNPSRLTALERTKTETPLRVCRKRKKIFCGRSGNFSSVPTSALKWLVRADRAGLHAYPTKHRPNWKRLNLEVVHTPGEKMATTRQRF